MNHVHLCKSIKTFDFFINILLLFWLFCCYVSSSDCTHLLIIEYLQKKIGYLLIVLFHFSMLCSWYSQFESALGHNSGKWFILTHLKTLRLIDKIKKALFNRNFCKINISIIYWKTFSMNLWIWKLADTVSTWKFQVILNSLSSLLHVSQLCYRRLSKKWHLLQRIGCWPLNNINPMSTHWAGTGSGRLRSCRFLSFLAKIYDK